MTTDTKALRALLLRFNELMDAAPKMLTFSSQDKAYARAGDVKQELIVALHDNAPDLLDAADERDVLRVEVARLRGDARALRNRLVSEISCRYRNEGGAYEESIALAERDVITFEDAFHAATERLTGATK